MGSYGPRTWQDTRWGSVVVAALYVIVVGGVGALAVANVGWGMGMAVLAGLFGVTAVAVISKALDVTEYVVAGLIVAAFVGVPAYLILMALTH